MLFKSVNDRTQTMLAYHAAYTPRAELTEGAAKLIVWKNMRMMRKFDLERMLNDDKTKLIVKTYSAFSSSQELTQEFKINWVNNNIPTEAEWDKKSATYLITVDLRVTKPHGRIALLRF